MEELIKKFLAIENGYGYGDGSGYGSGYGYGDGSGDGSGYGYGDGSGYGSGYGSGDGSGDGSGYGYGDGSGDGSGDGYGYGYGDGSGDGYGDGDGVCRYNGNLVNMIDGIATIITKIVGNLAKGFILNKDLTTTPCYIVKGNNMFAHGESAKKAQEALQKKIFENMDTDDKIKVFVDTFENNKKYPAKDFYDWHNKLTGSCEMGRTSFVRNNGIDLENGLYTVKEFIKITKNDFGGEIIERLEEYYE